MPRVLIIKPSSLGDIVQGLQVAQSLRAQMPGVEIDWVAAEAFAPLVEACPAVSRVMIFPRRGPAREYVRLAGEIRRERYDWALDFQGLARSAMLLKITRATHKAGRADAREGAGLLYRRKAMLPATGKHAHALDILLQFLPLMGLEPELDGPLVFRESGVEFPAGLVESRPVVIFPDSRRAEKQWPGFFEFTGIMLKEQTSMSVAWAGMSGPEPELTWPEKRFWNLIGRLKLGEVPELLAAARVVVSNDSGPMHLAAAMGRPVVALFGPTNPVRFGPYPPSKAENIVLRAPGGDLRRLDERQVLNEVLKMAKT